MPFCASCRFDPTRSGIVQLVPVDPGAGDGVAAAGGAGAVTVTVRVSTAGASDPAHPVVITIIPIDRTTTHRMR
jgi:hypothetical protein